MIPHLTSLGHSRGRLLALCLIVAVPLVAIAAALGVAHFQKDATDTAQARLLLENIRANAYKQSALEWRAIAEGEVGASSVRAIDKGSVEMNHDVALLADDGWAAEAHDLHALLEAHTEAVRDEFALLEAGREQAASKVDEERVDPTFELLQKRADALGRRISEHRTHADRRATVGAAAILILATIAIVLLLV
ncbi:MAG: hypothetical protein QOJ57_3098, partial [Thermoleophilaceae bacterium]|nr:hypothetical protein [Thermoleophilaceae bacterium]